MIKRQVKVRRLQSDPVKIQYFRHNEIPGSKPQRLWLSPLKSADLKGSDASMKINAGVSDLRGERRRVTYRRYSQHSGDYCVDMKFASCILRLFSALRAARSPRPPGPSSGHTRFSNSVHSHGGYSSSGSAITGAWPFR